MNLLVYSRTIEQDIVKQQLNSAYQNKRLPHALLFYGKDGMGQYALACDFIQSTLSHWEEHIICFPQVTGTSLSEDEQLQSYQKLTHNPYKNVIEEKAIISIRQIFQIEKKLSYKLPHNHIRIVSIWGVELLSIEASNSLLKILEEPPKNTHFVLVSNAIENILETIRSRCSHFHCQPLTKKILNNLPQHFENLKDILPFVNYSITKALLLQENESQKTIQTCFNIFELLHKKNWLEFYHSKVLQELYAKPEKLQLTLTICLVILTLINNSKELLAPNFHKDWAEQNKEHLYWFFKTILQRTKQYSKPEIAFNGVFLELQQKLAL